MTPTLNLTLTLFLPLALAPHPASLPAAEKNWNMRLPGIGDNELKVRG